MTADNKRGRRRMNLTAERWLKRHGDPEWPRYAARLWRWQVLR